jgi:hypothetical protein
MQQERGQAESGWRPPPYKNIEPVPYWGKKIARRNALCTWDVKHIGHSDPADLIGWKTPDRAFWNAQIHATSANTNPRVHNFDLRFTCPLAR